MSPKLLVLDGSGIKYKLVVLPHYNPGAANFLNKGIPNDKQGQYGQ